MSADFKAPDTYIAPANKGEPKMLNAAALDVLGERERQRNEEGWSEAHDDEHERGELAQAAVAYILSADGHGNRTALTWWPWDLEWWKPGSKRRDLVKAGALILAEIERLDRLAAGVKIFPTKEN